MNFNKFSIVLIGLILISSLGFVCAHDDTTKESNINAMDFIDVFKNTNDLINQTFNNLDLVKMQSMFISLGLRGIII